MKKLILLLLLGVFTSASIVGAPVSSSKSVKSKDKTEKAKTADKPKYDKLFEDSKKHTFQKGVMTIHLYDDKVYLEMPLALMGKNFLVSSNVES